jgi:hypothetical protein
MVTYPLTIHADIGTEFVTSALKKAASLVTVPPRTSFYVADHPGVCPHLSKALPKGARTIRYTQI